MLVESELRVCRLLLICTIIVFSTFNMNAVTPVEIDTISTITVTGLPSKIGYAYVYSTHTFLNYCPLCGASACLIENPKGVYENELTCRLCDADYCVVTGKDKSHNVRAVLTEIYKFNESFCVE